MTVYLCGGINGLTDAECNDWRTVAKEKLRGVTLDPMRRDYRGRENECVSEIVSGDKRDIIDCDVVLANCSRPSWGTAMEVMYAYMRRTPVVAVVPADTPLSPWVAFHAKVFRSLDEAIEYINGMTI